MKKLFRFFKVFSIFIFTTSEYQANAYSFNVGSEYNAMPSSHGLPKENQGVTIKEHLGQKVDLNLPLTDENGNSVTLKNFVKNDKPILLTFNYYRCKTLCGIQLTNLAKTLSDLKWPIGEDFQVVTISFDPTDTSILAKEKQKLYLSQANQPTGEWHFLTAKKESIQKITDQVGFYYKYLPERNEFSHAAAIYFIAPNGIITRYIYGIVYKVKDVKFALIDASQGKIGSTVDKFLLFCCNYDPNAGAYTGLAMGIMRIVSILSCLVVVTLIIIFKKKKNKKRSAF